MTYIKVVNIYNILTQLLSTSLSQTQTKKEMGRIDEEQKEWPTLCLKIQDPADVAQGIRILRGEESLGKIRCIQL